MKVFGNTLTPHRSSADDDAVIPPSATPTLRAARTAAACVAVFALLAACGGTRDDVATPGVAPMVAAAGESADNAVFSRVGDSASEPADALLPSETAPASTAPASTVPPSTVPPSTVPPITAPSAGVAQIVLPAVTGWAAFDLHLLTILAAGSDAVSATLLRDGEIMHEVALGERTRAGDSVTIGDRYRVASISKVITSITMLRLVEQGAIGLDDPVGQRLAGRVGVGAPAGSVDQITLRHLLTHRSGIGQYENLMFRRQVESCEQAAATGLSRGLERAPGTTLRYSNLNFCLVGLLIEELTGQPYAEVVQRELLAPLGIDGMRLAGTFDVADGDVEHRSDDGRNYMEVLGAAGSWLASSTDVATIINSLDASTPGWKPLSPPSLAAMTEITLNPPAPPIEPTLDETGNLVAVPPTTVAPPPPTRGYGMGLMIFGPESFGHTGTLESTHAMTARQADGLTWAITVSGEHPSSTRDLAGIVADALDAAGFSAG